MALWKESIQKEPFFTKTESCEADFLPAEPIRGPKEHSKNNNKESVIAAGLTIEGKIGGEGDVRIGGRFEGDVQVQGEVVIESGACFSGEIRAGSVTIEGEVEGNINTEGQVKLLESGQLLGDLKAATLTVAAGSRMRGKVEFGWDERDTKKAEIKKGAERKAAEKGGNGVTL